MRYKWITSHSNWRQKQKSCYATHIECHTQIPYWNSIRHILRKYDKRILRNMTILVLNLTSISIN